MNQPKLFDQQHASAKPQADEILTADYVMVAYADGGSRGNPGPAAIAHALYDSVGNLIEKNAKCIGEHTNNEAEYEAILWAIEKVRERSCGKVKIFTDSEFVVKQVKGIYGRKDPRMAQYAKRVEANLRLFDSFELNHVPRTNKMQALVDAMVNAALDSADL
jgi:ribonuclease HI